VPGATGHGIVFEGMIQAWTLTAEVTFYAALPIFAFLVRRAAGVAGDARLAHWIGVTLVIVAGIAARLWLIYGAPPTWVTVLPVYLAFFGTGMALAIVSVEVARSGRAPRAIAACGRHPWWCTIAALAAFGASTAVAFGTDGAVIGLHPIPSWALLVRFLMQWVVVAGLIIPAVIGVERGGIVRGALASRPALFLGAISYGIYLWHWAIIRWLAGHWFNASSGQTMAKVTLVGLPVTIAVAYASYRLIEKPAMNLAKKVR
jgi:peptidoglycan/LPS O-acetylase OafA/YrhL